MIITCNNNVLLFDLMLLRRRSLRRSLLPVDAILPLDTFALSLPKTVNGNQQRQTIADGMKADAQPGCLKPKGSTHPNTKEDTRHQIEFRPIIKNDDQKR